MVRSKSRPRKKRWRDRERLVLASLNEFMLVFFRPPSYDSNMSGITFMLDERGKKTAAVIDLRRCGRVWEDFYDTLLVQSRAREPRESLESVKRRLKLARPAHG